MEGFFVQDFSNILKNKQNKWQKQMETSSNIDSNKKLYQIELPEDIKEVTPQWFTNRVKFLIREIGIEVIQSVFEYAKANAKTEVKWFFVFLLNKNNWPNTLKNALKGMEKLKVVVDIAKKLPTVYKGFIIKTYNKIGDHINNILAQCSDAKNIPATFIWKCLDYQQNT